MIYVIDHKDSFTHNVVHQLSLFEDVECDDFSKINKSSKLFRAGRKFKVGRYHSLKLKEPFSAENFDISMRCVISGAAMSFENNIDKIYGFQFHPESFLTLNGKLLIKKILSA